MADSSRFNVFSLIDDALQGHSSRALNILQHLQAEGEDALKILNFVCREIRNLIAMAAQVEQGQNINDVMQQNRVWGKRMPVVGMALSRHDSIALETMLEHAARIDQSVKGLNRLNTWDELNTLLMILSGKDLALER